MLAMFRIQVVPHVADEEVDLFAAELRGQVIRPSDAEYDGARMLLGGWIDEYPALIACCADVDDVRCALDFAWQHRLQIAVRGGHGVVDLASGDGALVLDRSTLVDMDIDLAAQTAKVGVGVPAADRDAAFQEYGLVIDERVAVEVVLADGQPVRASEESHVELLRAALNGGDVGVVTAFEYRLRVV